MRHSTTAAILLLALAGLTASPLMTRGEVRCAMCHRACSCGQKTARHGCSTLRSCRPGLPEEPATPAALEKATLARRQTRPSPQPRRRTPPGPRRTLAATPAPSPPDPPPRSFL